MSRFIVLLIAMATLVGTGSAQNIRDFLGGGEFVSATRLADQLPSDRRDQMLAQVAAAHYQVGDAISAARTTRNIDAAENRQSVIEGGSGGAGGGAVADFQSLIDLIQQTIVPDTWEALGGPSTMAPYPQGVYVDSEGTLHECETLAESDGVADLKSLLTAPQSLGPMAPGAWRNPARLRCVSLRRLLDQWTQHQINRTQPPESLMQLAGISHVQYLFIDGDDIVLAGPVGGIESVHGWYRDRESGRNTLRLDFFVTCLGAALGNQPFGCTIDPTTEGLQRAATVAAAVQSDTIPIGKASEQLVSALGMQRVEVFGTAGDTAIGYVMVEADRHMKQLALGIEPMPQGVMSYMDVIEATIDQGPPSDLLLRLWFTSNARSVRVSSDQSVFEIAGRPIRLSGQNERALATGERGQLALDPRTDIFVDSFNKHWNAIRDKYPIYGSLESVFRAASLSELLSRYASTPAHLSLLKNIAGSGTDYSFVMPTPRQVESIATLRSVRKGRQRHHILIASGGVAVDSRSTLLPRPIEYPSLNSLGNTRSDQPPLLQRWWWDR